MPKIKDLGINIIPEGMQPLEIGGGAGGACGCTNFTVNCIGCTNNPTFLPAPCGCTHITNPCLGCTGNFQTQVGCGCTNITNPCLGCTIAITVPGTIGCRWGTCGITWRTCRWTQTVEITPDTPVINPGTLSAQDVAAVRQQLRERLDAIDAYEKSLGAEHFDARETELKKELEQLKARKASLKK